MRPIPLARVRLLGATGQNICGISATSFATPGGARTGDVLGGIVDRLTLIDATVLFEREGKLDELVPLTAIATMTPLEDIKGDLLGAEWIATQQRSLAEKAAVKARVQRDEREAAGVFPMRTDTPRPVGPTIRDDDGDELRPEAAVMVPLKPYKPPVADDVVATQPIQKRKPGRPPKNGPTE